MSYAIHDVEVLGKECKIVVVGYCRVSNRRVSNCRVSNCRMSNCRGEQMSGEQLSWNHE